MPEVAERTGMHPGCSLAVVLLVSQLAFASAPADDSSVYPHVAACAEPVRIDGVLEESEWGNAYTIDLTYEISPGENTDPPVRTEVYITHTSDYLYVGFRAYDPNPSEIRAHLSDRDSIYGDDTVSITLDTFNDEQRAFEFECNPLGIQRDALRNDAGRHGSSSDSSWDAIWQSAGCITDWGYAVEMAIPFNAISFPRVEGEQVWGVIAWRAYPRNDRHSIRNVPIDRSKNCTICQAAKVVGFEGISPGRNIEIIPTFTAVRAEEREDFPLGEMQAEKSTAEFGLTTSWGFTPSFQFDATVNPDFSQIEADAYQLSLDTTYTLGYREKRPFFLEGNDYFNTQLSAVYTRAISDPEWGIKLTGKEGPNAIGFYAARDAVTNLVFPGNQGSDSDSYDFENMASVFRFRRDLMNNSTIGVLLTDREGGDYYNRLMGVDGKLRFSATDTLSFQTLGSSTRYESEIAEDYEQPLEAFSDWSHELSYEHNTRNWNASLSHTRMGEGFRADLGFIPRVGYQRLSAGAGGTWYNDTDELIQRLSINGHYYKTEETGDGGNLEHGFSTSAWVNAAMQSSFSYSFLHERKTYEDISPEINRHSLWGSMRPNGAMHLEMRASFGDYIDYSNVRPGERIRLEPEFSIRIGRHLLMDLEHQWTRMDSGGGRLYLANVSQSHFVYQFNSRIFFRAIFQYVDLRKDQALYFDEIDPVEKELFSQLLFSYKVNPRTVLFVGYSDTYLGYQDISMTQSDRSLFMKIGYAWVL